MRLRDRRTSALLCAIIMVVSSCGSEDSSPTSPAEGTQVGPDGGIVTSGDGSVELNFPPGALAQNIEVTIADATGNPADAGMMSESCYEFGPNGSNFDAPVPLTIRYDSANLPAGVVESDLRLCRAGATTWTAISGSTVDTEAHTVSGEINSFSSYGPGSPQSTGEASINIDPSDVELPGGQRMEFSVTINGVGDGSVQWHVVQHPGGGIVSDSGEYRAPGWTGEFHVVVTSVANPELSDTATVRVVTTETGTYCDYPDLEEFEHDLTFQGPGITDGAIYFAEGIDWQNGVVWVADGSHDALRKYNDDGTWLGSTGLHREWFYDSYNNLTHRMVIGYFEPDGYENLGCCGYETEEPGGFDTPKDLFVDDDGQIYIAEYWNHRIQVMGAGGEHLRMWNDTGTDVGDMTNPTMICVEGPYVYTLGMGGVLKYTKQGVEVEFISLIPPEGEAALIHTPTGIDVDAWGRIYIVDYFFGHMIVLSPDGDLVAIWGPGPEPCGLGGPVDIEIDHLGNIFISDCWGFTKLSPEGHLLARQNEFGGTTAISTDLSGNVYLLRSRSVDKYRPSF